MNTVNLFNIMHLWFGYNVAAKAWEAARGAAWRAREAAWEAWEAWEAREAYRLAHMQVSFAILYRKKWGGHAHD